MFIISITSFIFVGLLAIRFCYKQIKNESEKINVLYSITIFCGTACNGASIVFFFQIPYDDPVCFKRALLITSGYSLLYCAITFRTAQLYNLYRKNKLANKPDMYKKQKKSDSSDVNTGPLGFVRTVYYNISVVLKLYTITLFVLFIMQVTIISTWMNSDNYTHHYTIINERRFVYAYTCNSNYLFRWIAIEIALFTIINLVLVRLLYKTFEMHVEKHKDLKWILLSMNNLILGFVIIVPLTNIIQNDDDVYAIYTITISFTTVGTVLALIGLCAQITIPCCNCCNKIQKMDGFNMGEHRESVDRTSVFVVS